ncbi:hypothetical protein [Deinococcus cellulosilyticus]|uniref:Beta-lactamase-related domain-containing protein n=1 Tax=Deinococcus cellulosilyticus (strain DSM 18568 / NBRC 106333 / KACC 11606 / 5516J-15) TaxID=1223518 RepID=A0A511N8R5_DEIC1|nr:hypothetical protein [Deinococcus cellulosilyticus]GEM49235.1 hypothetical protein DC3_48700 [Deinococcus cellulosilyticus NBRC 106333 = KACC 11606]
MVKTSQLKLLIAVLFLLPFALLLMLLWLSQPGHLPVTLGGIPADAAEQHPIAASPDTPWPRATLLLPLPQVGGQELTLPEGTEGLVVIRDGKIIHETFKMGKRPESTNQYSISSSVLTLLLGIASHEKQMDLDHPLQTYVPEAEPQTTLWQVLERSSRSHMPSADDQKQYSDMLLLARALEAATKTPLNVYTSAHLWKPIEAQNEAYWGIPKTPQASRKVLQSFQASLPDVARLGQLVLNGGTWKETRLLEQAFLDRVLPSAQNGWKGIHFGTFNVEQARGITFQGLGEPQGFSFPQLHVLPDQQGVMVYSAPIGSDFPAQFLLRKMFAVPLAN